MEENKWERGFPAMVDMRKVVVIALKRVGFSVEGFIVVDVGGWEGVGDGFTVWLVGMVVVG